MKEEGKMMTERERRIYEETYRQGKDRFGRECKCEVLKDGKCISCGRKVIEKGRMEMKKNLLGAKVS